MPSFKQKRNDKTIEETRKKQQMKKQKFRLLIEPTVEEELMAGKMRCNQQQQKTCDTSDKKTLKSTSNSNSNSSPHVINNETETSSSNFEVDSRSRKSRKQKSELASLLMVLFGSVLFLCCLSVRPHLVQSIATQQQPSIIVQLPPLPAGGLNSNKSLPVTQKMQILMISNKTLEQGTTITAAPISASISDEKLKLVVQNETKPSIAGNTTSGANTAPANPVSPANNEEEASLDFPPEGEQEGDGNNGESELIGDGNKSKLGDLIVSTANDAADLLLSKKASSFAGEPEENANDASDDGPEAEDAGPKKVIASGGDDLLAPEGGTNSNSDSSPASGENELKKRQIGNNNSNLDGKQQNFTLNLSDSSRNKELNDAFEVYHKWLATGTDVIELFSKKFLPLIIEHGYDIDASTVTGMLQVFNAIRQFKPWALKLLDSWTKLAPGILTGTQSDFGDYDECLSVYAEDPSNVGSSDLPVEYDPLTGLKTTTVVGRYCLADVDFPKPPRERLAVRNEELQSDFKPIELRKPLLDFNETVAFKDTIFVETGNFLHMLYVDPVRVGFCLTNKVDPDSFAKVFNLLIEDFKVSISFKGRCVTKYDRVEWTIQQRYSAWLLLTICSLVIVSTLFDVLHLKLSKLPVPRQFLLNDRKSLSMNELRNYLFKFRPLFTSFSLIRNTKRLFKPQESKNFSIKSNIQRESISCPETGNPSPVVSRHKGSVSSDSTPSIDRRSTSIADSAVQLINKGSGIQGGSSQYQANLISIQGIQLNKTNYISLIEDKQNSEKILPDLKCLHGIRVITMIWMIVNHTYLFGGFFVLWAHRRLIDIAEWPKSLSFQLVLNGWLTVETYFFLSALIIVLNVMPLFKMKKFHYFSYILHRLLRLLPAYTGLICLNFLWPLISSGPVWLVKGKSFIQTPCENYLWTNYLFINNWIWPEKQCMVHTWFLSADLQLYLVAPIIVYLLYRRPVLGHSLNIIVALIASIISGLVIYANKLLPTTLINRLEFDSIKQQLSYSYFATYQHMGPYCLGIFIGYSLYKRPNVKLPKHLTWTLWLFLPPLSFTTLLLTYLWNGAYDDPELINPSPLVSALYVAIHRTIWTSLVAWIVFACSTGRAKFLSSFLSHPIFIPLSRLSFSIYLVHLPIIMFRALNLRHTIEWTDSNILWEACGNLIVSLIFGYFLNVAFESPFVNLESVLFGREKKSIERAQPDGASASQVANSLSEHESDEEKFSESKLTSGQEIQAKLTNAILNDERIQVLDVDLKQEKNFDMTQLMGDEQNNLRKKSLKPKETLSVERIFGQQVALVPEKLPNVAGAKQEETSKGELNSNAPSSSSLANNEPSSMSTNDDGDTIYPMTSEYLRQQQQHNSYLTGRPAIYGQQMRPTQYVTLARTSRFDHDSRFDYQRSLAGASEVGKQHLFHSGDETINYRSTESSSATARRRASASRRSEHSRRHGGGRYNTLTDGSGSLAEWRMRQQQQHYDLPNASAHAWNQTALTGNWLQQSGPMIPRIDSSTLRRQQRRRVGPSGSIFEEEPVVEPEEK